MTNGTPSPKTKWLYGELKRAEECGNDARAKEVIRMIFIHDARARATDGAARGSDRFFLHVGVLPAAAANPRRVLRANRTARCAELEAKLEDAPWAYYGKQQKHNRKQKREKKERNNKQRSSSASSSSVASGVDSDDSDQGTTWWERKQRSSRRHGRKGGGKSKREQDLDFIF